MRVVTLAIGAALAVGLTVSASAAKKKVAPTVNSFEKCEQLAISLGVCRTGRLVIPHSWSNAWVSAPGGGHRAEPLRGQT